MATRRKSHKDNDRDWKEIAWCSSAYVYLLVASVLVGLTYHDAVISNPSSLIAFLVFTAVILLGFILLKPCDGDQRRRRRRLPGRGKHGHPEHHHPDKSGSRRASHQPSTAEGHHPSVIGRHHSSDDDHSDSHSGSYSVGSDHDLCSHGHTHVYLDDHGGDGHHASHQHPIIEEHHSVGSHHDLCSHEHAEVYFDQGSRRPSECSHEEAEEPTLGENVMDWFTEKWTDFKHWIQGDDHDDKGDEDDAREWKVVEQQTFRGEANVEDLIKGPHSQKPRPFEASDQISDPDECKREILITAIVTAVVTVAIICLIYFLPEYFPGAFEYLRDQFNRLSP